MANFVFKFTNFCYRYNKDRSGRWLKTMSNWLISKTSIWWENMGQILKREQKFGAEIPHFCYRSNSGWSDTNFTYIDKLANPINP